MLLEYENGIDEPNILKLNSCFQLGRIGNAVNELLVIQAFRPDRLHAMGHILVLTVMGNSFLHDIEQELNLAEIVENEVSWMIGIETVDTLILFLKKIVTIQKFTCALQPRYIFSYLIKVLQSFISKCEENIIWSHFITLDWFTDELSSNTYRFASTVRTLSDDIHYSLVL